MKTRSVAGLVIVAFLVVTLGGGSVGASSAGMPAASKADPLAPDAQFLTVVLYADADAYVDSEHPATNYGADPGLAVYWNIVLPQFYAKTSLLHFPVAQALPAGAVIQSASLKLYLTAVNCSGAQAWIDARRINTYWAENYVTGDTLPAADAAASTLTVDCTPDYKSWSGLEDVVSGWLTGANYGFMLAASSLGANRVFESRHPGGNPPQLEVSYSLPAPPPLHVGPPIEIWPASAMDWWPDVVYNRQHEEYLTVWAAGSKGDANPWAIWARRVGPVGDLRGWFNVATQAGGRVEDPVGTYSPVQDRYLVVYQSYDPFVSAILAQPIDWDARGASPGVIVENDSPWQQRPAAAYNSQDDEYLIVYENWHADADSYSEIVGRRVRASDGALLGTGRAVIATEQSHLRYNYPDVAYNPARNNYLVVYEVYHEQFLTSHIVCKAVSADLSTVGPEFAISSDTGGIASPAVAAGPDEYLVGWWESGNGPEAYVAGRRVGANGIPAPSGEFTIGSAAEKVAAHVDVAYGAARGYLVVWDFATTSSVAGPTDVYARYLPAQADPVAAGGFLVDGSDGQQSWPTAACAPDGSCLVAMWRTGSEMGSLDIRGRMVGLRSLFVPLILRDAQ